MIMQRTIVGLCLVLCVCCSPATCQMFQVINSFEVNLSQEPSDNTQNSELDDLSPPPSEHSTFQWVTNKFGTCYGCGRKSYKAVLHDCVHRLPMQLTVGNFSKPLVGVFKVPDSQCTKRAVNSPSPVNMLGCGPPCSDLRLLRGESTGCRCDGAKRLAYDVPKLICQNNRNRTVGLALCKFFYESKPTDYAANLCDYSLVCHGSTNWIAGNWTECSHENSIYTTRETVCVSQLPGSHVYYRMHESMCRADKMPPRLKVCPRWTIERYYKCNCGTGIAYRRVMCMQQDAISKEKVRAPDSDCQWHPKPQAERPCTLRQLEMCK